MIELEELPRKSDESMTGSTGSSFDFDLATASVYNQEEDVLIRDILESPHLTKIGCVTDIE